MRDSFILVAGRGRGDDTAGRPFVRYFNDLLIGRQIEAQMRDCIGEKIMPQATERLAFAANGFQIIHET